MNVSRRNFLKGAAAGTAGTALTAGVLAGGARADGSTAARRPRRRLRTRSTEPTRRGC